MTSLIPFAQVHEAVDRMLEMISNRPDSRFYQLLASMQSGKTQFIIEFFLKFKEKFANAMGIYIVGHNHKDFVDQNFTRLEYLENKGFYCLSFTERKQSKVSGRPLKSYVNVPILVFFDENHFADGIEQTIDTFLKVNKLYPQKNVYFVGVSATPFSSVKLASETTVMYRPELMPTYKSVSAMLDRGDVYEATPIIKKTKVKEKDKYSIIDDSPAYLELENIIKTKDHGYIILRIAKKSDADFFMKELNKRFGPKVYVRHWNQSKQILSPFEFFNVHRKDTVTVVIVQRKVAMGNTIPTRYVHMVYEYSPNATVATICQGLIGRCCGHGKINDDVKVFTHKKHAEAYSLFERGLFDDFYAYIASCTLKPSQRSFVDNTLGHEIITEVTTSSATDRNEIVSEVQNNLRAKYGDLEIFNKVTVNRLEANKFEGYWYKEIIDGKIDYAARKKLVRRPTMVSIFVDDRQHPYRIFSTFRTGKFIPEVQLIPRPVSIYSQMSTGE